MTPISRFRKFFSIKWGRFLFLAGLAAAFAPSPCLRAQMTSDTTGKTIKIGPFVTANWRSDDFKGTAFRQWTDAADAFTFTWKTVAGDQIGSIGVEFGSPYLQNAAWQGKRIAEIAPDCSMSTKAAWSPGNGGWFYWSIYGWTHGAYTNWGSAKAPKGHDNEFYIVFFTQMTPKAILAQKGCVAIGSVEADGMTFDCYKTIREHQSQWLAVCRTNTWNPAPSVKLRKIFDYWCSQGLDANQYVVSLFWALEGFGGSAGRVNLTNICIPNLMLDSDAGKSAQQR